MRKGISPLNTFQNCGISSMRVLRITLPKGATRLGIGIHGTELVNVENLPTLTHASLRVDDGTGRFGLNLKGNDSHRDSKNDERTPARDNVERTFHKTISYAAANNRLGKLNHIVARQQLCEHISWNTVLGKLGFVLAGFVNLSGFATNFVSVSGIFYRIGNKLHIGNAWFRVRPRYQSLRSC